VDTRTVDPARRTINKAGRIERRAFTGVSGGVRASRPLMPGWSAEASLMRSFMAPTVDHLFAEGPHLASFAYEIGNAALAAEAGWGGTLGLRWASATSHVTLTGYDNRFEHFHRSIDTGELEVGPGATGLLARYRYVGDAARLWGGEAEAVIECAAGWWFEAGVGYVNGTARADRTPLPAMPPVRGRAALRWSTGAWSTRLGTELWGAQRRVAAFEDPTAASATVSAMVSWRRVRTDATWSVVLQGHNLFDATVRDHLSRIRSISPEPGRDLRLGVRIVR
jgi:iron complex outermembrane receptor protein